jgi:hypothetical protein
MREVNSQVYTIQSQVPFSAFVKVFDEHHIAHLAVPTQKNYPSGVTSKPAIEGHLKTGQRTASRT